MINRKYFTVLSLMLFSITIIAQQDAVKDSINKDIEFVEKLLNYKIAADIDKSLFTEVKKNYYFSSDNKSGIILSIVPEEFETVKQSFLADVIKEDTDVVEQRQFRANDVNYFYTEINDIKDGVAHSSLFYIKDFGEVCVAVFGFTEQPIDENHLKTIEQAALSSELIKN